MIVAHLSDLHIGRPHEPEAKALTALVAHLARAYDEGEIGALALTGDLTDNGEPHEWRLLTQLLEPLRGMPIVGVLGNHDCGLMGVDYDADTARDSRRALGEITSARSRFAHGLQVWHLGGVKVIGLDSQRGQEGEILPSLARGELGKQQLAALAVELQDEHLPTAILLHHHPLRSEWAHELEDAQALRSLIAPRPQVRAVLYGHRHVSQLQYGRGGGLAWIASGKSTERKNGALTYRRLSLTTWAISEHHVYPLGAP